jgi:TolB-like protein
MIKQRIQKTINQIFSIVSETEIELDFDIYKKLKASLSSKTLAQKIHLTDAMLVEFEEALKQFYQFRDNPIKSRLVSFRVSLWLETICKNLNIQFNIDESISNQELAIKQVRALELMIRDIVNENLGGKQNVLSKLKELFKQDVVDKWLKSADETGVLSGTTFSELSNIFLDKNIFKSVEEIFESSQLQLSNSSRESLRFILEDIRLIRNAVAHNKKISLIQIEALNEYYKNIAQLISDSKVININPNNYLDLDKVQMESFIFSLKEDNKLIRVGIEEIKSEVNHIKHDTQSIRKHTKIIIVGIALVIMLSGTIFYFISRQSSSTDEMSKDIKDVKNMVSGDAELKNMTSTDDLTATKDLNKRTKDVNAKRLAIIYFDNTGGEANMDKLKKGLADMLITDLSNVGMLYIVERDKLESILKEQKLSNSKEFDPNTAAKVGKLVGAQMILTGGYFELGGSMRIDARFIDVETGKILKSDGVDGATSSFFKIQKQLSWKIINNLDIKLSDIEKKEMELNEKSKALSFDDLNEYSSALELYDKGKKAEAKKIANDLMKKYPDFEPVKNLLKKL